MSDTTTKPGRRSGVDATVALLLASGHSVQAAAAQSGVSESTIFRRLKSPEFRSRIDEIRTRIMEEATGVLARAATEAAAELQRLIKDDEAPKSVRLNACRAILEHALKAVDQTQMLRQVQELRDKIQELTNGQRGARLGAGKASEDGRRNGSANGAAGSGGDSEGPNGRAEVGGVPLPRPLANSPTYLSVLAE